MVSVVQWHTRRVAASYLLLFYILRRRKNRKRWKNRKIWTKRYIARNPRLGAYNTLVLEFRAENPMAFKNFLRMNEICFNELLEMIKPQIQKQDTNMRQSIPVGEKLALTLRYLAMSFSFTACFHAYLLSSLRATLCDPIWPNLFCILQYCVLFDMFTVCNEY